MQIIWITIAILLLPIKMLADVLTDKVGFSYEYYSDNTDTEINSPTFSFVKTLGEKLAISFKERIDAITAASIKTAGPSGVTNNVILDAVTGASSSHGYDDLRYATTANLQYLGDDLSSSIGVYHSTERDYIAKAIFGSLSYSFNEANSVASILVSSSNDKWIPAFARALTTNKRKEKRLDLSFTQLISPDISLQLIYNRIENSGYLNSPYHYLIQNNFSTFEKVPTEKNANAYTLKAVLALNDENSLWGSYRYYKDSWEVDAHTLELQGFHDINENTTIGLRLRYYNQNKANFFKNIADYTSNDKYIGVDYRLSDFKSYTAGLSLHYNPQFELLGIDLEKASIKAGINYYKTSKNENIAYWYNVDYLRAFYSTFSLEYEF